ncbi:MAG: nucleoside deaminase [Deltaproteobacteria bacterium]|nr:nucleoside deaminase [Deltaproteobacteria bacterium]MBW1927937.1 nucleoside deaminase [Deltaproteobacteria bacterium]MBW2024822.1 nucleoside deaminase [Deltaproteobacteria bacterium]MBW2124720.1 nucleoside deaminase [Deltaproteobacteria bacterium]RLB24173.1 MAG: tRNA-specific adenosine deaminase [Deltaproteobacteria bacterium]
MTYDLYHFMKIALKEAEAAFREGEVPIGAVVVSGGGSILAKAHNSPIALNDPTAHAEILALREAARRIGNYRLNGALLVVTLEPCPMCMGAALLARIDHLVYGAADPKSGAAGSLYDLSADVRLNHRFKVTSGILEQQCRSLLQTFFRAKRKTAR